MGANRRGLGFMGFMTTAVYPAGTCMGYWTGETVYMGAEGEREKL